MIVRGGYSGGSHVNTGARYNPSSNSWTPTTTTNAPDGRLAHAAVWTGSEMIVWGGYSGTQDRFLNTGGRYDPSTNHWSATSTVNAPSPREVSQATGAVWTGTEMIVWGGYDGTFALNTGGRYCAQSGPTLHYTYSYAYINANSDSYTYSKPNADANSNALRREMYTNAEATDDSASSPVESFCDQLPVTRNTRL